MEEIESRVVSWHQTRSSTLSPIGYLCRLKELRTPSPSKIGDQEKEADEERKERPASQSQLSKGAIHHQCFLGSPHDSSHRGHGLRPAKDRKKTTLAPDIYRGLCDKSWDPENRKFDDGDNGGHGVGNIIIIIIMVGDNVADAVDNDVGDEDDVDDDDMKRRTLLM
ncbi:hypothetical protein AAY473_034495, partial [Plecturocebus cupreus]